MRIRLMLQMAALSLPLPCCGFAPTQAADFDLVIRGGRVVDGSGNPWRYADVAVKGDRVVAVGRVTGSGEREVHAKGLVVSPGFVDIHSHSDFKLLQDGHAQSKIRQGVTTEILGEGALPDRIRGSFRRRR